MCDKEDVLLQMCLREDDSNNSLLDQAANAICQRTSAFLDHVEYVYLNTSDVCGIVVHFSCDRYFANFFGTLSIMPATTITNESPLLVIVTLSIAKEIHYTSNSVACNSVVILNEINKVLDVCNYPTM